MKLNIYILKNINYNPNIESRNEDKISIGFKLNKFFFF